MEHELLKGRNIFETTINDLIKANGSLDINYAIEHIAGAYLTTERLLVDLITSMCKYNTDYIKWIFYFANEEYTDDRRPWFLDSLCRMVEFKAEFEGD